jgi:hypothetical protein
MSEGGKEVIRADDEAVARAEILAFQRQVGSCSVCPCNGDVI